MQTHTNSHSTLKLYSPKIKDTPMTCTGFNQDLYQHTFLNAEVYFLEDMNASASMPPKLFPFHISSMAGPMNIHGYFGQCCREQCSEGKVLLSFDEKQ